MKKQFWHKHIEYLKLISRGNKGMFPSMIMGALATSTQPFIYLVCYSKMLDYVLKGQIASCIPSVVVMLTSALILGMIGRACDQAVNVYAEAAYDNMQEIMLNKAFTMEYQVFERAETVDTLRRMKNSEMGSGGNSAQVIAFYGMLKEGLTILYSAGFMTLLFTRVDMHSRNFFAGPWSTVVLLAGFILFFFIGKKCSNINGTAMENLCRKNDHYNAVSNYLINIGIDYKNGKEIRIYGMRPLLQKYYEKMLKAVNSLYLPFGKKEGALLGLISFMSQILSGITYIFIGAKAILKIIPVGDVLLYAGAILRLMDAVQNFIITFTSYDYRMSYLNTYTEFINQPQYVNCGDKKLPDVTGVPVEFIFEDVSFTYPDTSECVLEHINLTIASGRKMAIVGRNGAGKTTLIKLLCRLYEPTEGKILLNGTDIREYEFTEYAKLFSVVFQDFQLLSMPIGENIASGEELDRIKIDRVLEQVGMSKRMEQMEQGIETRLYKNNGDGMEVSGGEAQKIAIARALYKDGPFVILDEPTAALDPIAEAEIYKNFNDMVQDKSSIYISHRMSSCQFCDEIVVFDHGKIAEKGNHAMLMKKKGIYEQLFDAQAQYYRT
ncbi:MAG: ABC transporter ATP-binding protein [Lachnospiraceae bacterium]